MKKLLIAILMGCVSVADAAFVPLAVQGAAGTSGWAIDLSTGVKANQGTAGTSFWGVDLSTGVQVRPGTAFLGVDHSTGVQVNTGTRNLGIDLSTGVAQGIAGTSGWKVDFSTGVQVRPSTAFLGVDFSTGVQVNTSARNLGIDLSTGVAQGKAGTSFWGIDLSTGVGQGKAGTSFWGIDLSTGVGQGKAGTSFWGIDLSTGVGQGKAGTSGWKIDATTGIYVVGGAANNAAITGNPLAPGVDVASSTIPTGTSDGTIKYLMGDSSGRIATTGMPYSVTFSTYLITIASSVYGPAGQQPILVSSAGANLYTYLCGCIFTNTTATAANLTLSSPVGAATNSKSYAVGTAEQHTMNIGAGVSNTPVVIWPGCQQPFFRSALNSTISIIHSVNTGSLAINAFCQYYNAQ